VESRAIARKKPESSKKTGKTSPAQATIVHYKADVQTAAAVKEWLSGLADHVGAPVTTVIDMALKAFAEAHGYKSMPRRRVR